MSDEIKVQTPGGLPPQSLPPAVDDNAPSADDAFAAERQAMQDRLAQLEATNAQLVEQLRAVQTVPVVVKSAATARVIGSAWLNKTSAQAKAAGLKEKVLCSDGWYVPEARVEG